MSMLPLLNVLRVVSRQTCRRHDASIFFRQCQSVSARRLLGGKAGDDQRGSSASVKHRVIVHRSTEQTRKPPESISDVSFKRQSSIVATEEDFMVKTSNLDEGIFEDEEERLKMEVMKKEEGLKLFLRHKKSLRQKGIDRWDPPKKLTREAMDHLRALHSEDPGSFNSAVLSKVFRISVPAVVRILRSKWRPPPERAAEQDQKRKVERLERYRQRAQMFSRQKSAMSADVDAEDDEDDDEDGDDNGYVDATTRGDFSRSYSRHAVTAETRRKNRGLPRQHESTQSNNTGSSFEAANLTTDTRQDRREDRRNRFDQRQHDGEARRNRFDQRQHDGEDRRNRFDQRQHDGEDRRNRFDQRQDDGEDRRSRFDRRQHDGEDRRNSFDQRQHDGEDRRNRFDQRQHDREDRKMLDRRQGSVEATASKPGAVLSDRLRRLEKFGVGREQRK